MTNNEKYIFAEELNQRIYQNYARLLEPDYNIDNVFDIGSDWPGDKACRKHMAGDCV